MQLCILMVSDAEDNNSCPLLLILWWQFSFTSRKCTLMINAFVLIFPLSNITGSLWHGRSGGLFFNFSLSLQLSLWAWFWFSLPPFLEATPGALKLTFARYLGHPHRTLSTLAFGLLCVSLPDENKDQSRNRGGTAPRADQPHNIPSLYFSLMWDLKAVSRGLNP